MILNVNKGEHLGVVTLDGKRVLYPQMVDTVTCIVRAPLVDNDGKPIFDHGKDDFALVERQGVTLERLLSEEIPISAEQKSIFAANSQFNISQAKPGELSANWRTVRFSGMTG